MKKWGIVIAVIGLLSGCASTPPYDPMAFAPTKPLPANSLEQRNGSLYQDNTSIVLFEDVKARRIGDIITVVLTEKTNASKKAKSSTAKGSSIEMANATLLGRPFHVPAPWDSDVDLTLENRVDSSQKFDGEGDSSLSNTLSGNITVTVAEVLTNGYLVIKGKKRMTINQGDEYILFSGIVRPTDISADNTVPSTLVANAMISYTGEGALAEANQMGFLTRFFNKWWPL